MQEVDIQAWIMANSEFLVHRGSAVAAIDKKIDTLCAAGDTQSIELFIEVRKYTQILIDQQENLLKH